MLRKPKTPTQYRQEVQNDMNNPFVLAQIFLEISGDYAFFTELYGKLEIEKSAFFVNIKFADKKPLSDTACNAKWLMEDSGKDWMKAKTSIKAYDKLIAAIKNMSYTSSQEANTNF